MISIFPGRPERCMMSESPSRSPISLLTAASAPVLAICVYSELRGHIGVIQVPVPDGGHALRPPLPRAWQGALGDRGLSCRADRAGLPALPSPCLRVGDLHGRGGAG